jgi:hypothetical protein
MQMAHSINTDFYILSPAPDFQSACLDSWGKMIKFQEKYYENLYNHII